MARRINRYTGEDELANRLEALLARERRRVRCLGVLLGIVLGWLLLQMLPTFPFAWQVTQRGVCLNVV